jgi:predicted transcriptional regulator of viral defense system
MRLLPAFVLAVLAAACATLADRDGPVALDGTQRVGRYLVTPLAVEEDSRCPENARCVWAGRVVVRAAVEDGFSSTVRHFTLGRTEPGDPVVLDSVTPERSTATETQSSAYRFHFAPPAA